MTQATMPIRIISIWISPGHDFSGRRGKGRLDHGTTSCAEIECVAGQGIEGDRYYGHKEDYKGQITFISEEAASNLEETLANGPVDRSSMRRNVLISGVDLNSLIGTRFRIGEVVFSGSEECAPCGWMDQAVGEGAHEALKGNGGLRCRIIKSGRLVTGETSLEIL